MSCFIIACNSFVKIMNMPIDNLDGISTIDINKTPTLDLNHIKKRHEMWYPLESGFQIKEIQLECNTERSVWIIERPPIENFDDLCSGLKFMFEMNPELVNGLISASPCINVNNSTLNTVYYNLYTGRVVYNMQVSDAELFPEYNFMADGFKSKYLLDDFYISRERCSKAIVNFSKTRFEESDYSKSGFLRMKLKDTIKSSPVDETIESELIKNLLALEQENGLDDFHNLPDKTMNYSEYKETTEGENSLPGGLDVNELGQFCKISTLPLSKKDSGTMYFKYNTDYRTQLEKTIPDDFTGWDKDAQDKFHNESEKIRTINPELSQFLTDSKNAVTKQECITLFHKFAIKIYDKLINTVEI